MADAAAPEGSRLFPAWPKDWDVSFRRHAPYQTVVEGELRNGALTLLGVFPEDRKKDIVMMLAG